MKWNIMVSIHGVVGMNHACNGWMLGEFVAVDLCGAAFGQAKISSEIFK